MKRILLISLMGTVYFAGSVLCRAQSTSAQSDYPDNAHMQLVSTELDRIESSLQNKPVVSPVFKVTPKVVNQPDRGLFPRRNDFEFSSEIYSARFDEPKTFSQKGVMSGYSAQITHRTSTDPKSILNVFSLQGQWANGKFKQPTYFGGLSGIKDSTFDVRGVVGKDFYPAPKVRTTGYLGFGYRYLKDNANGLNNTYIFNGTQFSNPGFRSYSHYYYLPFGADIVYQPNPKYSWESNLEYDYMVHGWQVDKIGAAQGGAGGAFFNTLDVDQKSGEGLRASLRLNLYFKYMTAFAEGFYRYWSIAKSSTKIDPPNSTVSLGEPKNNTEEFGMRLGLEI